MPTTPFDRDPIERERWDDGTLAIYHADRHNGIGVGTRRGWTYDIEYDATTENPDGLVCNRLGTDGTICRLPRDHYPELPHMPFTADVVLLTGVYVLACHPPGTVTA